MFSRLHRIRRLAPWALAALATACIALAAGCPWKDNTTQQRQVASMLAFLYPGAEAQPREHCPHRALR